MRRAAVWSHHPSDGTQGRREGAAIGRRQRRDRRNEVFLDGDRGPTQQAPALRRDREPLTTPVMARSVLRDEPLLDQPLNHHRNRALVRTCERRYVID